MATLLHALEALRLPRHLEALRHPGLDRETALALLHIGIYVADPVSLIEELLH